MRYPTLYEQESSRRIVDVFKGYNHNLRVGDGEFYDMQNMTSDHYPILSPRGKRGVYASPDNPQGLIAKDALCYIDGRHFVMNEYRVDLQLSEEEEDCPKQLISMGAYVIIMPDKKYINTMDLTDFGNIEASYTTIADVTFELCNISGELFSGVVLSSAEPTDPANMDLWMDTSSVPHTLKKYSSSTNVWVSVATTYIRISSSGIG